MCISIKYSECLKRSFVYKRVCYDIVDGVNGTDIYLLTSVLLLQKNIKNPAHDFVLTFFHHQILGAQ